MPSAYAYSEADPTCLRQGGRAACVEIEMDEQRKGMVKEDSEPVYADDLGPALAVWVSADAL